MNTSDLNNLEVLDESSGVIVLQLLVKITVLSYTGNASDSGGYSAFIQIYATYNIHCRNEYKAPRQSPFQSRDLFLSYSPTRMFP